MENLELALSLMTKNCFMASIDLQDAYYSVNIDPDFRKYLWFKWDNILYEYTAAKRDVVPIDAILKTGGWTNGNTFSKFYEKTIVHN